MVGYKGCTVLEAKNLIDGSQGKPAIGNRALGHPRGHAAVEPGVSSKIGYADCVENYSAGSTKTSFKSRSDQELCANYAMSTDAVKSAMKRLNNGSLSEAVRVDVQDLGMEMITYVNGRSVSRSPMGHVVLVLRHPHRGTPLDLHVHTMYPTT